MTKLHDAVAEQEKLDAEARIALEHEVLALRQQLSGIIDRCAECVHSYSKNHTKSCRCLNCRDLAAIKVAVLNLKVV